jgi:hypothetical protein
MFSGEGKRKKINKQNSKKKKVHKFGGKQQKMSGPDVELLLW